MSLQNNGTEQFFWQTQMSERQREEKKKRKTQSR
jgi:hypothetical protein